MIEIIWWLVTKIGDFFATLSNMVLFQFGGADITLLGLLGAFIIISVLIRMLMPRI